MLNFFAQRQAKALTASPEVLQSIQERTFSSFPMIAMPQGAAQRIDARVIEVQSAQYGWLYRNTPAVRTVVDFIARNVAQLALRLYERVDDEERQQVYDHPAALSVRYPNTTTPPEQFIFDMVGSWCVYNNAYALKVRQSADSMAPTTLLPLPSHMVGVLGMNRFVAEGYRVWKTDGTYFDVVPDDIIHWRGYNPNDQRFGISPLETLRSLLTEDAASQQANLELMKAGLGQPGWVSRPVDAPEWSDDAAKRFQERLTSELASSRKYPVLEEGMEIHDRGVSPKDAEMLNGRRFTMEQVADIYGVPLGLLGLGGSQAQLADQHDQFYADVLPPITEMFASYLDLGILQAEYDRTDLYFEFDLDEKLQGETRIATYVSAAGGPIYTRDEIRRKLNLPPLPNGDGEEIITPLNVTVGGKPSPAVMPPQDPNGPPQDGSHRTDTTASLDPGHPNGNGNAPDAPPEPQMKELEVTTKHRNVADMDRQKSYIGEATAVFDRYYRRQAQSMKSKSVKTANSDRWNKELAKDLLALITAIVTREAGTYLSHLGGSNPFDMGQVQHFLKATADGTAEGINTATERDIADTSVQDAFDRAINQRAAVAGRSIGTRSTLFARQEAAKQSPNPHDRMQTWHRDTKRHAYLDGVTVPLGSRWPGGLEPGSEPNCACTATIT